MLPPKERQTLLNVFRKTTVDGTHLKEERGGDKVRQFGVVTLKDNLSL